MRRAIISFVLVALIAPFAAAQVATGIYPLGPFSKQGFDTINLANLNSHFSVPVFSKHGRGGMDFYYILSYDSSVWTPVTSGSSKTWQPNQSWGWAIDTSAVFGSISYSTQTKKCYADPPSWYWSTVETQFLYTDTQGTTHRFAGSVSDCDSYGGPSANIVSQDGSGLTLHVDLSGVPGFSLTDAGGRTIVPIIAGQSNTSSVTDLNGNQITSNGTSIVDTTGSAVLTISGAATQSSPRQYTYPVWESPSSQVTSANAVVNYLNKDIQTNFGCSGIGEYSATTVPLISSIVLADGGTYSFSYEATPGYSGKVTGRLSSITLPTGGVISYGYSGGANGIVCADGGTATLTRTMSSSSGQPHWVFARTPGSQLSTTHTVVTDGLSSPNSAVYDFVSNPTSDSTNKYYQTNFQQYQGTTSGQQLLAVQTCYNGATSCTTQSLSFPITSVATTNSLYGSPTAIDKQTYTFNSRGLVTEENDYDYSLSGIPTTLIRKVVTEYENFSNAPGLVQDVKVYDGSSNLLSSYGFNYDETSVSSAGNLPNHISGSSQRRNPTSKWILNASPQTSPTQYFTYNDAGQILTATDFKSNTTSYSYDSGTGTFVTQINSPTTGGTNHSAYSTWDISSGVKKTDVDQNGNTTSYTYDAMLRLVSITNPGSSSPTTSYGYNLTASSPYTSTSVLHAGSSYITTTDYLDPYTRVVRRDSSDSPHDDLIDLAYDGNGKLYSRSNPYRTGDSGVYSTFAYDGLGRMTSTTYPDSSQKTQTYSGNNVLFSDEASKQRELFFDGLGRISEVLEPDAGGALTLETDYLYAQNYSTSGGVQYQTIVKQKGGSANSSDWRQRVFTIDQLGRTLAESTPEGGQTSYTYYSSGNPSSFCSGDIKQPCIRSDANGTSATYVYDALNRLTGKSYSGSNSYSNGIAANTPSVTYRYDDASYNGLTIGNGIGRRTGMSDGSGSTAWSFDAIGNVAAVRRTINGQTKQANYAYNFDGSVSTLQDYSSNTLTYGYDAAGRPTGVSDSAGNTYASSAVYTAAGQLNSVNHQATSGSALYAQSFQYNNRLQTSVISATMNGNSIQSLSYGYSSGATNNGNILQITNGMNDSRNQTYTYDNMNRTASGRDASHWGETYTYDNWGNLYQTAQMSGLAGDNWSVSANGNNRLSNLAYDSAGQVTQDQVNNAYSFDAEGRILTVGSNSYTYDGSGSRVKKSGGTNQLYWTGVAGEVLNESDLSGNIARAYVYFNGSRIARRDTPSSVDVRFTNDSCSGCSNLPPYQDRNLFLNSMTVGTTTIPASDSSINYTSNGCSSLNGGVLQVLCSGDVILSTTPQSSSIGFNGYGSPDYGVYPHVQLYADGVLAAEFDVTASSQTYTASAIYFYLQDHLGSTRVVASASGEVLDDVDYYSFGTVANNYGIGSSGNHYSFTGYESDATESSTDYAMFRNLSYTMGRFNRPDPYGGSYDFADPQSLNRYAYVGNRPTMFSDPLGLMYLNCAYYGVCDGGGPGLSTGGAPGDPGMLRHGGGDGATGDRGPGGGGGAIGSGDPKDLVGPLLKELLDKVAGKAIPASPWKTVSGMVNCAHNFVNDIAEQMKSNFPNVDSAHAQANFASCIERVANGMANPF